MTRLNNTRMKKNTLAVILPVMFGFLAMGFIDMIGLVTNNVRADFNMSDGMVNTISLSCYLWFLLLSIPVGMALTKWGRKKMVLVSLALHVAALLLPYLAYSFASVLVAFSLIGIGNTILQVAMNPLVTDVVTGDRVTSTITFGQATKAFGSIIAPFIAMWTAVSLGRWQLLFPIYACLSLAGLVWLWLTPIEEQPREQKNVRFADTLVLLKDPTILAFFFGIVVLVAADVAVNMTLPRLMTDQFGLTPEKANTCNSVYFLARTVAAFAGGALLLKVDDKKFFLAGSWLAMAGLVLLALLGKVGVPVLLAVCLFGIGYANLFGIVFSFALRRMPDKANEVSALLIVGLVGGAILPPVLGWIRDITGSQIAAVAAIAVVWVYMLWLARKIRNFAA